MNTNGYTPIEGLILPNEKDGNSFNGVSERPIDSDSNGWVTPGYYSIITPDNYSAALALEKGLIEGPDFDEKFFFIQALYRKVLEEYLDAQLDLAHYEEMLKSAPTELLPREAECRIFYHRYSTLPYEFIYLRNNIHIERLSEEDLKPFERCWKDKEAVITDELRAIVQQTYVSVLSYHEQDSGWESGDTVYYSFGPKKGKAALNESVVFDIALEDCGEDMEKYWAMIDYLNETFIGAMEQALAGKLECPVVVHIGDGYSTKRNN